MQLPLLTHRGWFGLCPVYFGGLESGEPLVEPRHFLLTPLMMLSEGLFAVAFWCASAMDPTFEPSWPLRVTGKLAQPKRVTA